MRLGNLMEGDLFKTRLTGRVGMVVAVTVDRGVLVKWRDNKPDKYLHEDVAVTAPLPPELGN